jgi:hypothetical protein
LKEIDYLARSAERIAGFQSLGEIIAKGLAKPVTFPSTWTVHSVRAARALAPRRPGVPLVTL